MKITITTGIMCVAAAALAGCGGGEGGNASAGNGAAPAANAAAPTTGNEGGAPPAPENGAGGEAAAPGSQQDFTILNNTGQTVMTLNVSPSDQNSWGPDILGQNVLPNGQQGQVQFVRGQDQCNWDIRATFEGGQTGDWRNINLCETTTITLTGE